MLKIVICLLKLRLLQIYLREIFYCWFSCVSSTVGNGHSHRFLPLDRFSFSIMLPFFSLFSFTLFTRLNEAGTNDNIIVCVLYFFHSTNLAVTISRLKKDELSFSIAIMFFNVPAKHWNFATIRKLS